MMIKVSITQWPCHVVGWAIFR